MIKLTWEMLSSFDSFDIYKSQVPIDVSNLPDVYVTTLLTAFNDDQVLPNSLYYYCVASKRGGDVKLSEVIEVNTSSIIDPDLIIYLPFSESFEDLGSGGINWAKEGQPIIEYEYAHFFNGDRISTTNPILDFGSADFTFIFEISKDKNPDGFNNVISSTSDHLHFYFQGADLVFFRPSEPFNSYRAQNILANTFYQFRLLKDGTTLKFYCNELLIGQTLNFNYSTNFSTLVVGNRQGQSFEPIKVKNIKLFKNKVIYP